MPSGQFEIKVQMSAIDPLFSASKDLLKLKVIYYQEVKIKNETPSNYSQGGNQESRTFELLDTQSLNCCQLELFEVYQHV